jgi:diguanylate cyclase (GGDEF)-like protein
MERRAEQHETGSGSQLQRWLGTDFPAPYHFLPVRMHFADPVVEQRFLKEYSPQALRYSRLALVCGIALYASFGLLDGVLFPETFTVLWVIRFGIGLPLIALAFILTSLPAIQRRLDWLLFSIVQIVAATIIAMILYAPQPASHLYYAGLIIILIFNYTFLRMRFWVAVASGWMMILGYFIAEFVAGTTPGVILFSNMFFFVGASLAGMMGALISELFARRTFVQSERLDHLARTDELTGLPNRRHLMDRLRAEVVRARRYGDALSLAMIDVDHFKNINDRFGHAIGDTVLERVAGRWKAATREPDMLGRLGGEEFAVILPQTDAAGALISCERLRKTLIDNPIEVGGHDSIAVTASIGVTTIAGDIKLDDLLRKADGALYEAKRRGRNQVIASPN